MKKQHQWGNLFNKIICFLLGHELVMNCFLNPCKPDFKGMWVCTRCQKDVLIGE